MDVRVGLWRKLSAKELMLWTVALEKTLASPLDYKEIQPVHPKGDQSWVFIGRTDAEAETPILWPPHVKSWLIRKDPDAGRDWGQEEKGTTEDEMAGWHHQLDPHEFGWTPGVGDGQGGLMCCDSWGHKESDMTEWLNWTEEVISESESCSVVTNSWQPHRLYSPWNSSGQNTGVGSCSLQGIFPTKGSNPGLPHCRQILYQLSHQRSPRILEWVAYPFSRGSSWPRNWTRFSCIAGRFFTSWATEWEWSHLVVSDSLQPHGL